jgi:cysteine desulfurase/selenocysteine lyase
MTHVQQNSFSSIQKEFPILSRKIGKHSLVYLDNAATTQKPLTVLKAMDAYYRLHNANVHRGIYRLAEEATLAYELAHQKTADFIHAQSMREIIFTRGTTDSLNMLARMLSSSVEKGDEIVVSQIEHHSNLIPWQQLANAQKAALKFIPLDKKSGMLDLSRIDKIITSKTKIVSIPHVSNVLGTIVPIKEIARRAHKVGAVVSVDAAQSVPHMPVNVRSLECDFFSFSGHKMYGPTGIGVLWGKESLLNHLEPVSFGGEMVREVYYDRATWNDLPWKFEAGTPPIAEGVGLSAAIDFLQKQGMEKVRAHEKELVKYAYDKLFALKNISIYGPEPKFRSGVITFNATPVHPHDLASLLNEKGIAIRAGHHCAMPLATLLNISASARASFGIYNTQQEVDLLVESIKKAQSIFSGGKRAVV